MAAVVHDVVLLSVAGFVLWGALDGRTPSVIAWLDDRTVPSGLALLGAVTAVGIIAFGAWVVLGLIRQQGRLLLRIEALEAGHGQPDPVGLPRLPLAKDFALPNIDGRTITLRDLRGMGRPLLLVFTDPRCRACETLLPQLGSWQQELQDQITVVVVSRGMATEIRAQAAAANLRMMLVQQDDELETAFAVSAGVGTEPCECLPYVGRRDRNVQC